MTVQIFSSYSHISSYIPKLSKYFYLQDIHPCKFPFSVQEKTVMREHNARLFPNIYIVN
jgi:hypothetical protein